LEVFVLLKQRKRLLSEILKLVLKNDQPVGQPDFLHYMTIVLDYLRYFLGNLLHRKLEHLQKLCLVGC